DFGPRLRPAPTCSPRVSCVFQETRVPEKASRVLYRFREDTENRSPNSCRASRCSDRRARPRPTSEGIETRSAVSRVGWLSNREPDPAPPPRGLKPVLLLPAGMSLWTSPTPPHLRGD